MYCEGGKRNIYIKIMKMWVIFDVIFKIIK